MLLIVHASLSLKAEPFQMGAGHRFVCTDYVQGKVFVISPAGKIVWEYDGATNCNEVWALPGGNLLFNTGHGVREVTPDKKVVFDYESASEIYACQRLANGNTFVGECSAGRLLEVDPAGKIVKEIDLLPKGTNGGHAFMRNARKLDNGNYLVAHYGLGCVREYDATGKIIREIPAAGGPHSAVRLPNGNTLVSCADGSGGSRVFEVDANNQVVWQVRGDELPGVSLRFMAGLERLPNGNTLMCNWLGHRNQFGQTADLIEVAPDKKVVWKFYGGGTIKTISNVRTLDDSVSPTHAPYAPAILPGRGLAEHDFIYCGEWDTRKPDAQSIFIVRGGKVVWNYTMPMKAARGGIQEFDDVSLLPNGNVLFSRMSGAGIVSPDKKLVWNYDAPLGTEVHSAQYLGDDRVLIMRNGNPAQVMIFNAASNLVEREISIPTTVTNTHAQFRHIRMTPAGTLLVPHMGEGRVVEYNLTGKEIWSVNAPSVWAAVRLPNGNTLLSGNAMGYLREVNPAGETVWEFTQNDAPDIKLFTIQGAERLANGNTVFCNWCPNGAKNKSDWPTTVQMLEVTPEKKIVWALRSWEEPADLGPATMIQLLDEPDAVGNLRRTK